MKIINKIILACCILFSGFLKGQSQYVSPLFSYSFGLNSMLYSTYDDKTEISQDTSITYYTYNSSKFSLGGGKSFGAMYGKSINKNLSFEVGLNYFKGNEKEVESASEIKYIPITAYNVKLVYSSIFSYNSVNLFPSIIITANKNKWNPYLRVGAYLSYGKMKEYQTINIYNNLPGYFPREEYEFTYIYSPNLIVGLQEGIGIEFSKENFFNIFIEAQYLTLNFNPVKKDCVKYLYQDKDNMSKITNAEKTVYFVDTYNPDGLDESSYSGKQLKQKFSMNNISLQCGVKYYLK